MKKEFYQNGKLFINGTSGPLKNVFKNHTKCSYFLNIMLSVLVIFLLSNKENKSDDYLTFLPEKNFLIKGENMSRTLNSKTQPPVTQNTSLLCMVLTAPQNYHNKAVHVAATWGRRCTKLIFVSDVSDTRVTWPGHVDIVELEGVTGREHLWNKVKGKELLN